MRNSYTYLSNLKFWLVSLVSVILHLQSFGQEFTSITWGTVASQPYPVYEAQGKVVKGKLYTFGGFDYAKMQQGNWTPTSRAYVYNPLSNTWAGIASMPAMNGTNYGGVTHAGFTTDGTDIYFAGGYTSNSTGSGQIFGTKEVWKYIVSENRYLRLPNLPRSLGSGQLEYLNGKLHHIAGFPGNPNTTDELGDHYVLDLNNLAGGWKALAPLPNPKNHPGSTVYAGKIYFIGGQHGNDHTSVPLKDVHTYDPATNSWTKVADMPVPDGTTGRAHISSSVIVVGSRILVIGGETSHNIRTNMVSAYSPATNTWQNLTPFPKSVSGGVAGNLDGNIYYTGGPPHTKATYKGIPASQSTTLAPIADAFVRNGTYAAKNYGNDTSLIVKSSTASGYTRLSYLKFSLSNVSSVSSAKLRLYGRNADNTTTISVSAYGADNDSWTETGITFNNAPAAATAALSSAGVNNIANYYELDVTSYVKTQFAGDKIVTFLIKDPLTKNSNLVFNSKEKAANKPQLVVVSSATTTAATVSRPATDINNLRESFKKPVIYPNPMRRQFNIKFPADYAGDFNFSIADQGGRIYNLGKLRIQRGSNMNIDVSRFSLRPGVYFLRITSPAKNEEMKIVVQ